MSQLPKLKKELRNLANPKKAKILQGFFKTDPGQYGEGDVFMGITVPRSREIARKYHDLSFNDLDELLKSKIHEERLIALLILVHVYKTKDTRKEIVNYYLKNTRYVNNWDLVDLTADKILGNYLLDKDRKILYDLAKSKSLWEKRIAIISTFQFIRNNDFKDTLKISEILLQDSHDLMHKAVGWMLREVGKKDLSVLENFLKKHYKTMSRTTLRYAIEKFPEVKRQKYLKGVI
ncbi:MAG: DNA alkylation repair protein [Nanoarchaeota archaeon]|nr:DNA alkylation repair protein [Nanoarchaeota archaeon]